MKLTKQQYITIGVVIVLIAAGIFLWQGKSKKDKPDTEATPISSSWETDQGDGGQTITPVGNVLEGTLNLSDNKSRGNLMLKNASTTVYIYTSRDYSNLVGKEVKVIYDGTLDDFRLGDIVAK